MILYVEKENKYKQIIVYDFVCVLVILYDFVCVLLNLYDFVCEYENYI